MKKRYFATSAFTDAFKYTKNVFSPKNISLKKWFMLSLFYYLYLFPFIPRLGCQFVPVGFSLLFVELFLLFLYGISIYLKSAGVFLFTYNIYTGKFEILNSIKRNLKLINSFFIFYFLSLFAMAIAFAVIFIPLYRFQRYIASSGHDFIGFMFYAVTMYLYLFFICIVVFSYFIIFDFISIIMLKENVKTISAFYVLSDAFKKYTKEFVVYLLIRFAYSVVYFTIIVFFEYAISLFVLSLYGKNFFITFFAANFVMSQILLPFGYFIRAYSLFFVKKLDISA